MKYIFTSNSLKETHDFARAWGLKLKGGEVIQLVGDVGAGKTTFVQGLADGAGTKDHVSSPTFTICNTYRGRLIIHHLDFYRLHNDQLIEQELAGLLDGVAVVVLEWAQNVNHIHKLAPHPPHPNESDHSEPAPDMPTNLQRSYGYSSDMSNISGTTSEQSSSRRGMGDGALEQVVITIRNGSSEATRIFDVHLPKLYNYLKP